LTAGFSQSLHCTSQSLHRFFNAKNADYSSIFAANRANLGKDSTGHVIISNAHLFLQASEVNPTAEPLWSNA